MTNSPFVPDMYCRDFYDIPWDELVWRGRTSVILDVDNTIISPKENRIRLGMVFSLSQARGAGIKKVCLVSNVIFGNHRIERVRRIAEALEASCVCATFRNRKPKSTPFLKAMEIMGSTTSDTFVIGDQVFTDIAGGNRLGLYTVLVDPLGPDGWATRLTLRRFFEKRILRASGLRR